MKQYTPVATNYLDVNSLLATYPNDNFNINHSRPLTQPENLRVELDDKALWTSFARFTNEMILTKAGRRTFPLIRISMSGLDEAALYTVQIEFRHADNQRYRFVNGEWKTTIKSETASNGLSRSTAQSNLQSIFYKHPDSPNFGNYWTKELVTFARLKLTNNESHANSDMIFLKTLYKYEPIIHVFKHDKKDVDKGMFLIHSMAFKETQFIAVTAYQNENITSLKIVHNPFAKAFLNNKPLITIENDQVIKTEPITKREFNKPSTSTEQINLASKQQINNHNNQTQQSGFNKQFDLLQNWYNSHYPIQPSHHQSTFSNPEYSNYYSRCFSASAYNQYLQNDYLYPVQNHQACHYNNIYGTSVNELSYFTNNSSSFEHENFHRIELHNGKRPSSFDNDNHRPVKKQCEGAYSNNSVPSPVFGNGLHGEQCNSDDSLNSSENVADTQTAQGCSSNSVNNSSNSSASLSSFALSSTSLL